MGLEYTFVVTVEGKVKYAGDDALMALREKEFHEKRNKKVVSEIWNSSSSVALWKSHNMKSFQIDVSVKLTLSPEGKEKTNIDDLVAWNIHKYLKCLQEIESGDTILYSQIANAITAVECVIDYSDLLINGQVENIHLNPKEEAYLGELTID